MFTLSSGKLSLPPFQELLLSVGSITPPAPEITIAEDGWHVPLALEQGALIAAERESLALPPPTAEELARKEAWAHASPQEVLDAVHAELEERANPPKVETRRRYDF